MGFWDNPIDDETWNNADAEETNMLDKTVKQFNDSMNDIYHQAKKLGYPANYLQRLIQNKGGWEAAKQLINVDKQHSGLSKLWELKRLDLSVEALVLKPEYVTLFTDEERKVCKERLIQLNHKFEQENYT
jgi:hypothetical protein